jgi:anaerobic selenocysteine-containing dehydrogenase
MSLEKFALDGKVAIVTGSGRGIGEEIATRLARKGAKVVVIDPLKTYTAEKADEWIGLRPGTDGALALGIAHVMMEKGSYDSAFADDWTHGLRDFREYVKNFSPKVVEQITWVKAERIERLGQHLPGK